MNRLNIAYGKAICYSGFRDGQSPETGIFPSYEEVKEDLLMLHGHWQYLRLYDCDQHSATVLNVIEREKLDFKVMLGAYIVAELSNPNCPWGGVYSEKQLKVNKAQNRAKINTLVEMANRYPSIIFSLSAGNEAAVEWTDHLVPVESLMEYVSVIKRGAKQAVTFCDNYVPWLDKLEPLVELVDFISIHSYPVWEYKGIDEGISFTKQNYYDVVNRYPDKPVVITEAGWATNSNGRGIDPENVSEELQRIYYQDLMKWCDEEEILTFVFEAFDESWKGSPEPLEPEKHWGLFKVDRKPKLVLQDLFDALQ
jgi:exo-beta-1,3-glucanase (GH17 family)